MFHVLWGEKIYIKWRKGKVYEAICILQIYCILHLFDDYTYCAGCLINYSIHINKILMSHKNCIQKGLWVAPFVFCRESHGWRTITSLWCQPSLKFSTTKEFKFEFQMPPSCPNSVQLVLKRRLCWFCLVLWVIESQISFRAPLPEETIILRAPANSNLRQTQFVWTSFETGRKRRCSLT